MKVFYSLPLLALGASPVQAQDSDVEQILVTTAIHTRSSETALPVTLLSGEELHDAASATIGDTLANQAGLNNASFGPAVGQAVIRGQQGARVRMLINGVGSADASNVSADHAVAIEPVLAESLEVLRGPATLLYGGGAIGGVVNVIDGRIPRQTIETPEFTLEKRHDTAADEDTLVSKLKFGRGKLAWHLDFLSRDWNDVEIPGFANNPDLPEAHHDEEEHEEDEHEADNGSYGFIGNTGGKTRTGTLGFSYVFEEGYLGFAVNHLQNDYGIPAGTHQHGDEHAEEDHDDDEHEEESDGIMIDLQRTRYDLSGEWQTPLPLLEKINYSLSHTDYGHDEVEGPGMIGTRFSSRSWKQRLQLVHTEINHWHGVLGLQSSHEDFSALGEESFIPVTAIDSTGLFLVEDYHLGDFTLELGARIGRDELKPRHSQAAAQSFTTNSYSASGLFDINPVFSLGLTLSHSERAPTVEELYSNSSLDNLEDCVIHGATGSCEIGNPDFNEERSLNGDLTLFFDGGKINGSVTAFYNRFDDYMFLANRGLEVDEAPIYDYQQADARFRGLELDVDMEISEHISVRLYGDMIRGDISGQGNAPRMPPNRLGWQLNWQNDLWSFHIGAQHAAEQDRPGNNETATDSYTRWDLGADYRLETRTGDLLFYLKGRNISNEDIRLSTSVLRNFAPEAGRSLETGIRYRY